MLADPGWRENRRTADKTAAGLAAANWAHGEKHGQVRGRLSAARAERGDGENERAAATAGKRERVRSNVQICHLLLALRERLAETPHADSPEREVIVADASS